jgi:hypothetical protein
MSSVLLWIQNLPVFVSIAESLADLKSLGVPNGRIKRESYG